jgi:hypothetical protein
MHPYLYPGLEAGPRTLKRLIHMIEPGKLDQPTHPGRFTPREVIAHCADWEPISRSRMETAVQTPGAGVPGIDEEERAREQGYDGWDPYEQAEKFIKRRAETIAFLKGLRKEDWSKTAVHSERGEMTVYDYANMELAHDMYHVVQLCAALPPAEAGTW